MQIQLQMVGAYQNVNKSFKGIPFVNGRATVTCADEHVAGLCRYLQQYGAYPVVEAEVHQAKLDKDAGKKISKKTAIDRVQRCQAALTLAKSDLDELGSIDDSNHDFNDAPEDAAAPPSQRPAPRVVTAEPSEPEPTSEPVAAAPADVESEFDDGRGSDQQASRRERSETSQGGKSSNKARKVGK